MTDYDVIVIGCGPAGMTSCGELAKKGFKVLGIDKKPLLDINIRTASGYCFLDQPFNDEIIKRRLAQKMEFISDEFAESLQPTKKMLLAYYKKHKENYQKPSVFSLKQVYFSEDKRSSAFEDAQKALNEPGKNIPAEKFWKKLGL